MTAVSVQLSRTYKIAVDGISEEASGSIVALNGLMEKCKGLGSDLKTLNDLAAQM